MFKSIYLWGTTENWLSEQEMKTGKRTRHKVEVCLGFPPLHPSLPGVISCLTLEFTGLSEPDLDGTSVRRFGWVRYLLQVKTL